MVAATLSALLRASELGVTGQVVDRDVGRVHDGAPSLGRVAHGVHLEPLLRPESGRGADRH